MSTQIEKDVMDLAFATKRWMAGGDAKFAGLQRQMDAIDAKGQRPDYGSGGAGESLAQRISDSGEFKSFQGVGGRGRMIVNLSDLSLKTVTSATLGVGTSGVLMPERVGGIVTEARRQLRLRDLLTTFPCTGNSIDFVSVSTPMTKASPQSEGSTKAEVGLGLTTTTQAVRTIAAWIACSKQVIEDMHQLRAAIDSSLIFAVEAEIENQLLFGDNTGQNLHGLAVQAQDWDVSNLWAGDGYEFTDVIGGAVQQIVSGDELAPNFVVLHPADWWKIRRCKSSIGTYLWGPPNTGGPNKMWELNVVPSSVMDEGYFLVGNSSPQACAIFERMGLTVELSSENQDFFERNLVAVRAESRIAMACFRPNAFCFGSLTQSPA